MMPNSRGAAIESHIPGRIRVRLPRDRRNEAVVSEIEAVMKGVGGVSNIYTNVATGSVLVEYDPQLMDVEKLVKLGRSADLISDAGEAMVSGAEELGWLTPSLTARRLIAGFKQFDVGVNWLTRGMLDAKMGVPLLLLVFSLGRAFVGGNRSPTPWHSLLWYSYSMFMHWNRPTNGGRVV